jgi:putative methionine-R-sulfoxide reductase with GAF domain
MERLAREEGATILLVTHDNRILDIADRIVHLEDGHLTTFRDQVIANNQLMMTTLAESRKKQNLARDVEEMDEDDYRELLQTITAEAQSFIEATALAGDLAFRSMLEEALEAFTRKLRQLSNADRASLFLIEDGEAVLKVSEDLGELGEVRVPVGKGLAGTVALTGESIRIDDAYQDPRFNREVDRRTGYRTRSVMCLPVIDHEGRVFAVAQLLNRRDGQPFDATDEARFGEYLASLGVIFESLELLTHPRPRRQGGGARPEPGP